jgi:prophage antirepressor-like protein
MEQIQSLTFEGNMVRTINRDGEMWWVLKDVCDTLDISDASNVAKRLENDEKDTYLISTLGGTQDMLIISESGLYNVILRSDKPKAKPFRKWVTSEVIPSIRKTGVYSLSPVNPDNTELFNRLSRMESEYFLLKADILEERFNKLRNEFNRTRVSDEPLEPELMVRIEDVIRWWLGLPTVMKPIPPKG